ncbi:fat storage-inducing transmembrane protein [Trichonephila clavata]|uniref:Fat storage-inducing transmembrane protein n=1 Tax=Trichonephila clavata TaxID=2740835 RepID=A0A8X6FH71_TRICU|nr:fat storage-inducing transmembrane protein [Trichonephila clavata]
MGGVKRQSSARELKWQNFQAKRSGTVGKKPLPDPTTLKNVFLMIIMHVCRKIVLFETEIKITIYLAALVCGSLVGDFTPVPRSYFSRKNNLFNYYFVKWGWAWTLISVSTFLWFTSYVYCCGNKDRIIKHFYRLLIGTAMWFCMTKFFIIIEAYTVGCMSPKYVTKLSCLSSGSIWKGFDISGHAFLLIYCSLLIAEEGKAIRGWERIGDLIRNEEFDDESPLKNLTEDEMEHLKENYNKLTPYVRLSFIGLTAFILLWDVMLVATIVYFHSMVQKVVGGVVAILVWYFTYKWWYKQPTSPGLPGQGCFKYCELPPPKKMCAH